MDTEHEKYCKHHMSLDRISEVVAFYKSRSGYINLNIDCDDTFIAYYILKTIVESSWKENLMSICDSSPKADIMDEIKRVYENLLIDININEEEDWNQYYYDKSDGTKMTEPFEMNRFLNAITKAKKQNNLIHVTNYKYYLNFTTFITDNY